MADDAARRRHALRAPELDTSGRPEAGGTVVVHGHGTRVLRIGKNLCATRPGSATTLDCPIVSTNAFGDAIEASLHALGVTNSSPVLLYKGASPITIAPDAPQADAAWGVAVTVWSWADADAALAVVAGALDAWGIGGDVTVSIEGIGCASPAIGVAAGSVASH
jgi:hypothetical protein